MILETHVVCFPFFIWRFGDDFLTLGVNVVPLVGETGVDIYSKTPKPLELT